MTNPQALFLDRDGTLIVEKHYLSDPNGVELEKTAVEALKLARSKGARLILVTNQSGIGRGYYTEADYHAVHDELIRQLKEHELTLDASYFCPNHPEKGVGKYLKDCNMRKPKPGMLLEGVSEFDLDPERCVMIGDKPSDIEAGKNAGMATILIDPENTYATPTPKPDHHVKTLLEGINKVITP